MIYLLGPLPQAEGRGLYRVEASKAICAENVVPVPNIVLEGNGLLEDGVQHLPIGLRGGLAQQQPFQLVLIACVVPPGLVFIPAIGILCKPLRARRAAARQVSPPQRVKDPVARYEARLRARRR